MIAPAAGQREALLHFRGLRDGRSTDAREMSEGSRLKATPQRYATVGPARSQQVVTAIGEHERRTHLKTRHGASVAIVSMDGVIDALAVQAHDARRGRRVGQTAAMPVDGQYVHV